MTNDSDIYTLHKYFIWANKMRTDFDNLLIRKSEYEKEKFIFLANLYMSYWYAGLYVVIEGWSELGLGDEKLEVLLASPLVDLLRRYRNGVFHYQKNYFDRRFMDLIEEGKKCVEWMRELNREFGRYFLEWAEKHEDKKE